MDVYKWQSTTLEVTVTAEAKFHLNLKPADSIWYIIEEVQSRRAMEHIKKMGLLNRVKVDATDLIDNYTLLVLSPDTTPQGREATKTSVLFSQLATTVNRITNPKEWAARFSDVLAHIGWTTTAFNMEAIHINGPTVFADVIVNAIESSSKTYSSVKGALRTLTTKRPVLFFKTATSGNRATILIVATSQKGEDTEMMYCVFCLEAAGGLNLGNNFLTNEFQPQQIVGAQIGVTTTTLNREQYERVRPTLRDKLFDALLPYEQL